MLNFRYVRWKNLLSTGNHFTEIKLDNNQNTLVVGENGSGKCVCINTPIRIQNKKTGDIIETTMGKLYAQEKQNNGRED